MKCRFGFISNSSSTSFTINNATKEDILKQLEMVYDKFKQMLRDKIITEEFSSKYTNKFYMESNSILDIISVFEVTSENKDSLRQQISDMTCWGFKAKEFKAGQVWIISNHDNTIHYDLNKMIKKHFNVDSQHLG
jgi:hypothetical protein